MKIYLYLFLGILIILSGAIYFLFQPESLIDFVPEDSFVYLHLDLNSSRRRGNLTNQWLNSKEINSFLEDNFSEKDLIKTILGQEKIDFFDEIGLIGLNKEKKEIIFLVKIKRWVKEENLIKEINITGNFIQKISPKIYLISKEKESIELKNKKVNFQNKIIYFSNLIHPPVLRGFLDLNLLGQSENLIKINSFWEKEKVLSFELVTDKEINKENDQIFLEEKFLQQKIGKKYVFIFPPKITIEDLKDNIKKMLAWQNPLEKTTKLPDNTEFTELIINPEIYNFKEKEKNKETIYYLPKNKELKIEEEIFIWPKELNYFVSNDLVLLEKTIKQFQNDFYLNQDNLKKGLVIEIKEKGLEKFYLTQQKQNIKAYLYFE